MCAGMRNVLNTNTLQHGWVGVQYLICGSLWVVFNDSKVGSTKWSQRLVVTEPEAGNQSCVVHLCYSWIRMNMISVGEESLAQLGEYPPEYFIQGGSWGMHVGTTKSAQTNQGVSLWVSCHPETGKILIRDNKEWILRQTPVSVVIYLQCHSKVGVCVGILRLLVTQVATPAKCTMEEMGTRSFSLRVRNDGSVDYFKVM